jgi:hypothetical protein
MKTTIKILSLGFLTFSLLFSLVFAQSPEKISYQAILRDANSLFINNQTVGIQISILQGSISGTEVYKETQTATTNTIGLVSLEIGTGTVMSGEFATINWANGPYFIKTETDPTGGTTYTITGSSQLMNVPYALYAKTAETIVDEIEADPLFGVSLASQLTATNTAHWNNLTIDTDTHLDEATVDSILNYSGYLPTEVDGSLTNEIELPTGGSAGQVLETDGAGQYSWVNSTTNTDNQNIVGAGLTGTDLTIAIEGGTSQNVDLSTFHDGDAWGVNGEETSSPIGRNGSVGIGTLTPSHKLHVEGNAKITEMPSASLTDSIVFRSATGELRQMSVERYTDHVLNNAFSPSGGSLSGTPGACTMLTFGTYIRGLALDNSNYISVEINVTTAGSFTISTNTVNGYSFHKQAIFLNTGIQHITVPGFGAPVDAQLDHFTLFYNGESCTFDVQIIGPANGTLISPCEISSSGLYFEGQPLNVADSIRVAINVSTIGSYSISTNTVNGYSFHQEGAFTSTGIHHIALPGTGAPIAAGLNTFTVTYGAVSCTVDVTVNGDVETVNQPCNTLLVGTYYEGLLLNNTHTITIDVNITAIGNWTASTNSLNGYSFAGSGTASTTGIQTITLIATGSPVAIQTDNFIITFNNSVTTCTENVTVEVIGAMNCASIVVQGVYYEGKLLNNTNKITVTVNFLASGNWTATTNTVNGYSFSGSGTASTTGVQTITLMATGTPVAIQTDNFTITFNNSTPTCAVDVSVLDIYRPGTVHCSNGRAAVVDITSPTGAVWMDRNLGASQVATNASDASAYGDLYQWGRFADGHQCRNSSITTNQSASNTPGHGLFITIPNYSSGDWKLPPNNNLWQGVNGVNNPCPKGYRLPTNAEYQLEINEFTSPDINEFKSIHKFTTTGYRRSQYGDILIDAYHDYWSSSVGPSGTGSFIMNKDYLHLNTVTYHNNHFRGYGFVVRCIKD